MRRKNRFVCPAFVVVVAVAVSVALGVRLPVHEDACDDVDDVTDGVQNATIMLAGPWRPFARLWAEQQCDYDQHSHRHHRHIFKIANELLVLCAIKRMYILHRTSRICTHVLFESIRRVLSITSSTTTQQMCDCMIDYSNRGDQLDKCTVICFTSNPEMVIIPRYDETVQTVADIYERPPFPLVSSFSSWSTCVCVNIPSRDLGGWYGTRWFIRDSHAPARV